MEAKRKMQNIKKLSFYRIKKKGVLPAVAILGKNGGGKSNVIRAFWLGVQFIRKCTKKQQHEKSRNSSACFFIK